MLIYFLGLTLFVTAITATPLQIERRNKISTVTVTNILVDIVTVHGPSPSTPYSNLRPSSRRTQLQNAINPTPSTISHIATTLQVSQIVSATQYDSITPSSAPPTVPVSITTAPPAQTAAPLSTYPNTGSNGRYTYPGVGETQWQSAVLNAHNYWRSAHGTQQLVWSDDLAAAVVATGNSCEMQHRNVQYNGHGTGQNIAGSGGSQAGGSATDYAAMVDGWYNEILYMNATSWNSDITTLENVLEHGVGDQVPGHFTEVIWSDVTTLGCGLSAGCDNGWSVLICNYYPQGNLGSGVNPYAKQVPPRLDMNEIHNYVLEYSG